MEYKFEDLPDIIKSIDDRLIKLELEEKIKLDYMLKINQLEKNDKAHQALYDKIFKEIAELRNLIQGNANSDLNHYSINENRISKLREKQKADTIGFRAALKDIRLTLMPLDREFESLKDQVDKLAKYILEYFPGNIINEGACLTAIAIMEELRTKHG